MKIKLIGKAHLKGTSKKTGNPSDFIQVHYNGADHADAPFSTCPIIRAPLAGPSRLKMTYFPLK